MSALHHQPSVSKRNGYSLILHINRSSNYSDATQTFSALERLPQDVFLNVLDHIESPITIFALQSSSRTMLRKTKRPDGGHYGVRRRRPWPSRSPARSKFSTWDAYQAARDKIINDFYSSKAWAGYVQLNYDFVEMSLKSEDESSRRRFRRLTCAMCGKVKTIGVDSFAECRFSNKIPRRECSPCYSILQGADVKDYWVGEGRVDGTILGWWKWIPKGLLRM